MLKKRLLDIACSALLLVLLSPLWLVIVLWIRSDSPGPALFRQRRVGKGGELFTIYKFRTMAEGSERQTQEKLEGLKAEGKLDAETFVFQEENDPRVTRSGKFLRGSSLDELPQLLNILRGEMSLVGPRPEVPEVVAIYTEEQRRRLLLPPGVTGLAQVNGRSRLSLSETLRYDVAYVDDWSFFLDLKILWRTVFVVWRGQDAF